MLQLPPSASRRWRPAIRWFVLAIFGYSAPALATDAPPADPAEAPEALPADDAPPADEASGTPPADGSLDAPPADETSGTPPADGSLDAPPADEASGAPPADEAAPAPAREAPRAHADGIVPPRVIEGVAPIYPRGADGHREILHPRVRVGADGQVLEVLFDEGTPPLFREPALRAIEASTFAPATRHGQPIEAVAHLHVIFEPPLRAEGLHGEPIEEIDVVGHKREARHGASDLYIDVRSVQAVQTADVADALKIAPGLVVTRVGSEAQPVQVFLRGFDARHGQDIQFRLDGMPLNQVGNPHGHGLVDLNFLIPEAIDGLNIQEGPFDPAQGDFAVAGSVDFSLGLAEPGLMLKAEGGSFGTGRAVVGFRHPERRGTFAIAELFDTRGYGENRDAQRASLLARVEGDAHDTHWSVLGGLFTTAYSHAGLVRRDDVDAGRIDLFGTADPDQGGTWFQGFTAARTDGGFEGHTDWTAGMSFAQRTMRLRSNYTGFLTDDRRPGESDHDQRGDLLEQASSARTFTADARATRHLDRGGPTHAALDLGLYGRLDTVQGQSDRLRASDTIPYRTEQDYSLTQGEISLHGGLELGGWDDRLTVKVGARASSFTYLFHDHCPSRDGWYPGIPTDTMNCPSSDRYGVRLDRQRRVARGWAASPRLSADLHLLPGLHWMAAVGRGTRSMEAAALSDGEDAPFGDLWAAETGILWSAYGENWRATHRAVAFGTQVGRDLIFDEERAANVVAGQTRRAGFMLQSEAHLGPFTEYTSLTWTHAVFGDDLPDSYTTFRSDRIPGMAVPYVPPWVLRSDWSMNQSLGPIDLRPGLTLTWLSARPLPQSERSEPVFTLDAGLRARRGAVEVHGRITNLLNARYPLAEYNFASWFPEVSQADFPTRLPTRHVSPGAPRAFMVGLTLWPDARKEGRDAR